MTSKSFSNQSEIKSLVLTDFLSDFSLNIILTVAWYPYLIYNSEYRIFLILTVLYIQDTESSPPCSYNDF